MNDFPQLIRLLLPWCFTWVWGGWWGGRDVWYQSPKKFQVLRCAPQHQATTRQWPHPTEKPFQFQPSSSSFCQAWVSLQTKLFHWARTKKVCVCVRFRTKPKLSTAATQWAHEQNAFVVSFSVFHSFSLSISTTEESRIVKQKKMKIILDFNLWIVLYFLLCRFIFPPLVPFLLPPTNFPVRRWDWYL